MCNEYMKALSVALSFLGCGSSLLLISHRQILTAESLREIICFNEKLQSSSTKLAFASFPRVNVRAVHDKLEKGVVN